jgi:hypothetical protein
LQTLVKTISYLAALLLSLTLSGCSSPASPGESLSSIELGEQAPSKPEINEGEFGAIEPLTDDLSELEIDDQAGSGFEVIVEEVRLSRGDGFLVVSNQGGEALGYSVVTPDSQPVIVSLSFRISSSQELTGELFLDNGDGIFSRDLDFPIRDEEGEGVRENFFYTLSE